MDYQEFIGAKKHLVLGFIVLDSVRPSDQTHLLLDNRYNGESDHQAMLMPCRQA